MEMDKPNLAEDLIGRFISREDRVGQAVQPVSVPVKDKDEILKRLEKHLAGDLRLGLYNLLPDGTVRWAVVEFEAHGPGAVDNPLEAAQQYRDELVKAGITSYIERSKSLDEENYHLWIFFDTGIEAHRVNRALKAMLMREGLNPTCEVIPKTDKENPDGNGQFMWAPFFGGSEDGFGGKNGGGIPSDRTVFLNGAGSLLADPAAFLAQLQTVSSVQFEAFESAMLPHMPGSQDKRASAKGTAKQLQRVLDNCPFIKWCIANAYHLPEPLWWAMISNLCRFEGGPEKIHEISRQDAVPGRYDPVDTDVKIARALESSGPITYDVIVRQGWDGEAPSSPKSPAGWGSWNDPIESPIIEQRGCYGKRDAKGEFNLLTPFTIEPKELLVLPDGDVLTCTVAHATGQTWNGVTIENTDWHTRGKLMKALGHSECTFHGSDLDVIDVCQHVISRVQVRKKGTRIIGLHEDIWAIKDSNISAAGYLQPMELIPYDRSDDSLHSRVVYQHLDESEYATQAQILFNSLLDVNLPEAIWPIVGWFFAAPMKPLIMGITGSFPLLFCYGTQGGGKTSLLEVMLSMQGYQDPTVYSCTMKPFPMLTLLCSTNAVPVVLDEYKPWDMRETQVLDLGRLMRKIYKGEVEDKGNADKTVSHYKLQAPVVVCGESKVKEAAVLERVIVAGFTDEIKRRPDMQKAFETLRSLDLAGFTDRYLMFCLGQDVKKRFGEASAATKAGLGAISVAPRILNNLTTITFGLELMKDFAQQWEVDLSSRIDLPNLLAAQVEEITGDGKGQVKLAADVMLEQLALLAERRLLMRGRHFTLSTPDPKGKSNPKYDRLCLHFQSCVQVFKANTKLMGYDGEILDSAAYLKQLKTRDYFVENNKLVRFRDSNLEETVPKKALIIDVKKALDVGLDLSGFDSYSPIHAESFATIEV